MTPWLLHLVTNSFFRCQCQNQRRDKSWWNSGRNSRGTVQIRLMTQKPIGRGKMARSTFIEVHADFQILKTTKESGVGSGEPNRLEVVQWRSSWYLPRHMAKGFTIFMALGFDGFPSILPFDMELPHLDFVSMAARWPFPTSLALTSLELWRNSVKASQVWQLETRCEVEAC